MNQLRQLVTTMLVSALACACATVPTAGQEQAPTAESLFQQGLAAQQTGDSTRAEQYLAAALESGASEQKVLPVLLATCLSGDRYDTALHYARRHLLRHPDDWSLRYLVANLHFATGQEERARKETERLIEEQPKQPEPHYLLALVEAERPRGQASTVAALNRYLTLAPRGPHANDARRMLRRAARTHKDMR